MVFSIPSESCRSANVVSWVLGMGNYNIIR